MSFNSKIIIAKNIKMDRDYNNVLSYSESAMLSLVQANQVAAASNYSFIRPSKNRISTHFNYNQVLDCNYIAFQNSDYSNKWFFAWIDEVVYKNNGATTEIVYTVDEWSTWFDYWTKKACLVIREHVNDDTIGLHTVPENISVGEVVCEQEDVDESFVIVNDNGTVQNHWVIIETNYIPNPSSSPDDPTDKGTSFGGIDVVNSVITGSKYCYFYINSGNLESSYNNIQRFLYRVNLDGHIADIRNIFPVSSAFVSLSEMDQYEASSKPGSIDNFQWYINNHFTSQIRHHNRTIQKNYSFTSQYQPKNNKLYCYPYNYLYVTNNNGASNVYKYEDFYSSDCVFETQYITSMGCQVRTVPRDYKEGGDPVNYLYNYDESLPLTKYPTFSWSSDAYTNWLTQNDINLRTQILSLGMNTANSTIAGANNGVLGAVSSGTMSAATGILGYYNQFYQAELMPNITGGNNTGDLSYVNGSQTFIYKKMRCKNEYLEIIDSYFSKYGYKINKIKEPNITGRAYWNYVEIAPTEEIGYGEVPSLAMQAINNACRKGVTIWHNHSNLGNYSLTNSIS